jgi:hypothetical protein
MCRASGALDVGVGEADPGLAGCPILASLVYARVGLG